MLFRDWRDCFIYTSCPKLEGFHAKHKIIQDCSLMVFKIQMLQTSSRRKRIEKAWLCYGVHISHFLYMLTVFCKGCLVSCGFFWTRITKERSSQFWLSVNKLSITVQRLSKGYHKLNSSQLELGLLDPSQMQAK